MTIRRNSQPGIWLIDAFRGMGVDGNALLHALPDETARLLKNPESITADDLNRILLACEEQTNDPHFGLHLIESIELTAMGLYGYLLLNASTIGEFLSLAEHYYPIFYQSASLEITKQAGSWRLVYRRSDLSAVDQRHDDEWTLGVFVNTIRSRLGSDWQPLRTTFQGPAPKSLQELERTFGPNLSFKQPLNSLRRSSAVSRVFFIRCVDLSSRSRKSLSLTYANASSTGLATSAVPCNTVIKVFSDVEDEIDTHPGEIRLRN
jgi:hypothetical protein